MGRNDGAGGWAAGRMSAARQLAGHANSPAVDRGVCTSVGSGPLRESTPSRLWAASGAQAVTAVPGPPPGDVAGRMAVAGVVFEQFAAALGAPVSLDGAALLGERAALAPGDYEPVPGRTLRGHGRMVETAGGWLAVNLPRSGDLEALPALSLGEVAEGDVDGFVSWARTARRNDLVERGGLLGLALGAVPERPAISLSAGSEKRLRPWSRTDLGPASRSNGAQIRVVDFSGLWAGPLCSSLLAQLGAEVVRVEGTGRSDAPSGNDEAFNALLAANVCKVRADLADRSVVRELTAAADIVVTSSRIPGLVRLGLKPRPGQTWIRITAHGAEGEAGARAGFGDDAGASAGAVVYGPGGPSFAADAVADPVTGLLAAVAGASVMLTGQAALFDLSLSRSAAWAMGPQLACDSGLWPSSPARARVRPA